MSLFSACIGIDCGTANIKIYKKGVGIILNEPALVAVDKLSKKVLAAGFYARDMANKFPENIVLLRPVKNGEIVDYNVFKSMLSYWLDKYTKGSFLKRKVLAAIPSCATDVQKKALEEALVATGAKSVELFEKNMLAAKGANVFTDDLEGRMIIDVGAGTTEVAVTSAGVVVSSASAKIGGDDYCTEIIKYIKENHSVSIGYCMAEEIKMHFEKEDTGTYMAIGTDISTGLPGSATVDISGVMEAAAKVSLKIIEVIKSVLESVPQELVGDIIKSGCTITGGVSKFSKLRDMIDEKLDIKCLAEPSPELSVISGLGAIIQ